MASALRTEKEIAKRSKTLTAGILAIGLAGAGTPLLAADEDPRAKPVFNASHRVADILTAADQQVYMPRPDAGCPMADMASVETVEDAWDSVISMTDNKWLPVVYVNSSADIKGFCGARGGSTCTSSNARKIFEWRNFDGNAGG